VTDFYYIVFGKGLIITPKRLPKPKAPFLFCRTWDGNPIARPRALGYYFVVFGTAHL